MYIRTVRKVVGGVLISYQVFHHDPDYPHAHDEPNVPERASVIDVHLTAVTTPPPRPERYTRFPGGVTE